MGQSGRLFARTSPRARRTDTALPLSRPERPLGSLSTAAQHQPCDEPTVCACGLALEFAGGHVYNEEAFQYFLSIERKRTKTAGRHLLLALVDLKNPTSGRERDDVDAAQDLFAALRACLRETDFVGWYRENELAGVVLPQFCGSSVNASTLRVGQRLSQGLAERLPAALATRLEVHVYEVSSADQS